MPVSAAGDIRDHRVRMGRANSWSLAIMYVYRLLTQLCVHLVRRTVVRSEWILVVSKFIVFTGLAIKTTVERHVMVVTESLSAPSSAAGRPTGRKHGHYITSKWLNGTFPLGACRSLRMVLITWSTNAVPRWRENKRRACIKHHWYCINESRTMVFASSIGPDEQTTDCRCALWKRAAKHDSMLLVPTNSVSPHTARKIFTYLLIKLYYLIRSNGLLHSSTIFSASTCEHSNRCRFATTFLPVTTERNPFLHTIRLVT